MGSLREAMGILKRGILHKQRQRNGGKREPPRPTPAPQTDRLEWCHQGHFSPCSTHVCSKLVDVLSLHIFVHANLNIHSSVCIYIYRFKYTHVYIYKYTLMYFARHCPACNSGRTSFSDGRLYRWKSCRAVLLYCLAVVLTRHSNAMAYGTSFAFSSARRHHTWPP